MSESKKQALQKILEALIPYREMAEWFLLIIKENNNEKIIDTLFETITKEIKSIINENNRKDIKKALENIKDKEQKEKKEENKYLDSLLNNI